MKPLRNWKTTIAGIAAILIAVGKMLAAMTIESEDAAMIAAGVGLISARDHDRGGGSITQ